METVGMNSVDDARMEDHMDPTVDVVTEDGYYRSQKEVDEAFKKRLAAERQKWERETRHAGEAEAPPTGEEEEPDAGEWGMLEEREFLSQVVLAEQKIQENDPGFDMEKEFERNPMFALMLASGFDPQRVYSFFYPVEERRSLKAAVEREVMDRIRLRNTRPVPMGSANTTGSQRDISRMTEEEIRDIDARVKRGERVRL
ncbi:hypothetical protein LJC20_03720 [Eubacteriales bacterium OttesenSCG-928-M02]|nr:hypothetical protein [Eubacteriales bacterium OttesenSCG-928-M02]